MNNKDKINAEPVLKWAGGKRQIIETLVSCLPESFEKYFEPMVGGGALFFHLEPEKAYINDLNPRLMNFYRQVGSKPEKLLQVCKGFRPPESEPEEEREFSEVNRKGREIKNYYYQQRELFNRRPNNEEFCSLEEAALMLYLNRTCFNGLYRENLSGEFNVPVGRYSNPDWVREEQVLKASELLKNTGISTGDLSEAVEDASDGDLVYFDPPYKPMSGDKNFTDYTADGFGRKDQERLLKVIQKLDERGVKVMVSNSAVMRKKYLDAGLKVRSVKAKRSINSDGDGRGEVKEILATNYIIN